MAINNIWLNGFAILSSAGVTIGICWRAIPIGRYLHVMAIPDRFRRDHSRATPQIGGLAILAGFALWLAAAFSLDTREWTLQVAILLGAFPAACIGLADDRKPIAPVIRIVVVAALGVSSIFVDRELAVRAVHLQMFGHVAISLWACALLTSCSAVGLVSAINMADGRNGLVGSLFVIWFGCVCALAGDGIAAIAGVILLNAAIVLFFNIRGSLFLGDAGTFGLSFLLGLLIATTHARGITPVELLLAWFTIPLLDCFRLMVARPLRGLSPFHAGHDHFHHHLEAIVGRRLSTVLYVAVVAACSVAVTVLPQLSLGAIALQGSIIAAVILTASKT